MESITQIARGETGMVLIIYNDQICKEILMPNMYNTDYQIRLDASGRSSERPNTGSQCGKVRRIRKRLRRMI